MSNVMINIASEFDSKGFKKAQSSTTALEKQVNKLGKAVVAAFSAQKIMQYSKASVLAYAEDRKAAALLSNQLKNLGLSYAAVDVEKFIANLESQTGILDDELRPAFAQLVRVTGSVAESQKLMQVAFDTSRGAGIEYLSAVDALSKAYVGNFKGLKKLNLGLTDAELKTMKFEEIVNKLNKQFKGAGAASVDTYAGKIDRVNVALANAQETIGEGLVDAFTTLATDNDFNAVINGISNMAQYTADTVRGIGEVLDTINRNTPTWLKKLFGNGNVRMIPIIGDYLDYLSKTGSAAKVRQSQPQNVKLFLEEQKADMKRLQLQKKITDEERKQLAAKRAKVAIDKANAALSKGKEMFDLEGIQIQAALQGNISQTERARLETMKLIYDLEKAIEQNNISLIEQLTAQLNTQRLQTAELNLQEGALLAMKELLGKMGYDRSLFDLGNISQAMDMLNRMSGLQYRPSDLVNVPNLPQIYDIMINSLPNAAAEEVVVQVNVTESAKKLVDIIMETVTEQSASGNPPFVGRVGESFAW